MSLEIAYSVVGIPNEQAVQECVARAKILEKYPDAKFGEWTQCEEPEAPENEYVLWATVDGEPVAAIYEVI